MITRAGYCDINLLMLVNHLDIGPQAIYWTLQICTVDLDNRRSTTDFEWSDCGHDMELSIHRAHVVLRSAIGVVFRK